MLPTRSTPASRVALWLLYAFLAILLIAGSSSRADAAGQVIVRAAAWAIVIAMLLTRAPGVHSRVPLAFLAAVATLATIQLVPLPPGLWASLPGRDAFTGMGALAGVTEPWRPISIVPSLTLNALESLVVPLAVLMLMARLTPDDDHHIFKALLIFGIASAIFAVAQIGGSGFDNPFIQRPGEAVAGPFANRNHYALMLAVTVLVIVIWCADREARRWRWIAGAMGLGLAIVLTLATGSRAGLLLLMLALLIGALMAKPALARQAGQPKSSRKVAFAVVGLGAAFLLIGVLVYMTGRAYAIERLFALDAAADMRNQARPVVLALIGKYLPFGSGLGTFDPVYRISEPNALLALTYFNHAHSDWLEFALDGGLFAIAIMIAGIVWYLRRSANAWRGWQSSIGATARLGSAILLLVMVASVTDYPLRTPLIMALVAMAATWLAREPRRGRSATRKHNQSLYE